ncbi:DHA2 family efflux MFS transporter permease subunit [Aureimonas jatrophae]|uniref:MFS transporter, DHA2 family, multidrug resistance protein n=1 Tax=Aureimonas jatrophae TaxID=1166073 RepID=A0A1H0L4F0_9HYPH|nr:DHA2 family efflux MFS transporter permease subunit [Aureimonas jatrophae]MBB3952406.1 DHA2 family multidrug resistance protein [Aureimonas jatrophae]SDO63107.1 MFS transporter, DHA2 family, multidrug resistance protein [Aureimonas jatrophae]
MSSTTLTAGGPPRAAAPPAAPDAVPLRRMLAFMAMVFGMFMAILDIQIVSASLAEIQAGLSASTDEIAWVQTAYLIAEVIMIPLSGFLARMLSTRVLFTLAAAGFTASSALCATATNIDQMIFYRALQGFIGGGMIPSVFAAAFTIFPPSKRAVVSPMIGLVATLAPTIGPTVGGYLSHALSWHWLFLVNVPFGIVVAIAVWNLVDFDKPNLGLFKDFDWFGLLGMAAFLGSLEYVLEEGPLDDWFDDDVIVVMTVILVIGALLFLYRAFTAKQPIVDLTAFTNRNFAFGSLFSFIMGVGLYGLTYLYPVYLGRIRGYDSLMIGETMFVSGLAMFATAPISGKLSTKLDPRVMMLMGFTSFALGTWLMSGITHDWDFRELFVPQILRGFGLMMAMVPINNVALGTLTPDKMKGASGLYNLTRNLGGAVGLAIINTMINDRTALHYDRLAERVRWGSQIAEDRLSQMAASLSAGGLDGSNAAIGQLTSLVRREASVMAFSDVFLFLTALFAGLCVMTVFIAKPKSAVKADAH